MVSGEWLVARKDYKAVASGEKGAGLKPGLHKARRKRRPAAALQKKRRLEAGLLGHGKQQLISVGIDDLDHVVTPPGLLGGHRALDDFTAKRGESIDVQCHEQARLVCSRGILAKDDLASRAMDLADPALAVALMPTLLDAKHPDVEAQFP